MKNLTVLAAAFAAGVTTFAAYAQEEGSKRKGSVVTAGAIGAWTSDVRAGKEKEISGSKPEQARHQQRSDKTAPAKTEVKEARLKDDAVPTAEKAKERYKVMVERYASENGVPVELAHAVITVESNYRPHSRGKAGEVGLMQIKPATARLMGYKGSVTGLFDPETNIKFGMKYLGKARKLSDGTTCGTILKYNAGHGAKRMNPVSRNYCKKVKLHLAKFG